MLWAVIVLELVCIVSGSASAVAGTLGINSVGLCNALQDLVWVKWGIGTYLDLRCQEGIWVNIFSNMC